MRRLQPEETLDRHLQRIVGIRCLWFVPPAVAVRIKAKPAAPQV